MQVRLHQTARTTPATRRELQASTLPTATLARLYNVSEETVRKWRNREDVHDASHCPQRLQTTLTRAQEAVVMGRAPAAAARDRGARALQAGRHTQRAVTARRRRLR
jgi:uncharacterized protein YjcR